MNPLGTKDLPSILRGGRKIAASLIAGVNVVELGNVITRSGHMAEIFRTDWPTVELPICQVNWQQLKPAGVTDWHVHERQVDHVVGVEGNIKLALFDDRVDSSSRGASETIRLDAERPVLVVVPAGV